MKVHELITKLQNENPELEVHIESIEIDPHSICGREIGTTYETIGNIERVGNAIEIEALSGELVAQRG